METKLLYMNDWDANTTAALVVDVVERDGKRAVILDRTVFYPQGGGQPADHGEIVGDTGVFRVNDVRFADGIVYHFGEFVSGSFGQGAAVTARIDTARRALLSRLHTAGHLIDVAMEQTGRGLSYSKAYHFPDNPYVEYVATMTPEECAAFQQELQINVDALVKENISVTSTLMARDELEKVCLHVPDYLPEGKPICVVSIGKLVSCPCGGTHVPIASAVGRIEIVKAKCKGGVVRVSYQVREI